MHVAGAYGADQLLAEAGSNREYDEHMPSVAGASNRSNARFTTGMCGVHGECRFSIEQPLDLVKRDAMFGAFLSVAGVPFETRDSLHLANLNLYVQMSTERERMV
jgi:hypothetical protein